jgi:hypothetical protein
MIMKCLSKARQRLGFIIVLTVAVLMMVGFSAGVAKADPFSVPMFNAGNFPDPPDIDNLFFTLMPGTAFCYESDSEDGEVNEVTVVTNGAAACTLTIDGVKTIVVRDAVRLGDGTLTEDTYDFYAQDNDGIVWYLGEATKECEDGNTEGTWNADPENMGGLGGIPGIIMLADPMSGNSYEQEFLEGVAEDMAQVRRLNADVTDYCDKDCLKTKEWTPLAPGDVEHKYYAQNIEGGIGGNVRTEELKGGQTVLTDLVDVLTGPIVTGHCPSSFTDAKGSLCNAATPPPTNCAF